MTRALFENWLREWDQELAKTRRKVCLLLDNCSAPHCLVSLKHIELCFFAPNATTTVQPLDQGIIRAFIQERPPKTPR
ncbi:hypothetical protein HPB48_014682 [Haemaphysalis longicornis]|uniref:DDE-1 domain-containing protein n=1 Tax=Haemaphysalis longicornis TaxID=44386 RepID=A0A9J6GKF7_HAELO|nr:hypothetical protein HPB48_014682 [Haemaphysalis longicornis]